MEPRTWVKRDDDGKAVAAIVFLPHKRGGTLELDWVGERGYLEEGDWELGPSGPFAVQGTSLVYQYDASDWTEEVIDFFFRHPEELLYCLQWWFSVGPEHPYRHAMMFEVLNIGRGQRHLRDAMEAEADRLARSYGLN